VDKKDFFCTTPFTYTEVFDKQQFLCCPGWLKEDIYETDDIQKNFHSEKSNKIRESIVDGSYKYCDEQQCPYLASLSKGRIIDRRLKLKSANPIPKPHIANINLCFDRSCNLQCPSCRSELINYLGNDRISVDNKLRQIEENFASTLQYLYLSGSADPFFSKSFRQFLINFDPTKFSILRNIHLHTNGLLWTESLWNRMKAIHKYVNTCEVSIDAATKDTYENKVRVGGNWDTLLERLNFILSINTIKKYTFSFVVQGSNFKEMYLFWELLTNINKKHNKKINIFFNHIINWGTFTDKEYIEKDISNTDHKQHSEFLKEINKVNILPNVSHNFKQFTEKKSTLI
jgi:MoaA/NifB/PqqE/SkfB family radical SAM enzyme